MANSSKIQFIIEHIDPLGQGVFKQEDKIYFIPKTLPGESGEALILKKKKGVHFAQLSHLSTESTQRIQPDCVHYNTCGGCHYQHCSYETELNFKLDNFARLIGRLDENIVPKMLSAPKRFNYRNRVQLHYNTHIKRLGFLDANNKIIEVDNCIIANKNVTQTIQNLYLNQKWLKIAPKQQPKGHIEIYDHHGKINVTWNESYAHGGFTQVYEQMNDKLIDLVSEKLTAQSDQIVLDLFGGNGNLSQAIDAKKFILDYYTRPKEEKNFYHLDLLDENSIAKFRCESNVQTADWFLVDPPRKGFPNLKKWCQEFNPKKIVYVSCHPQTMLRDLQNLEGYQLTEAYMLDLFPATFHYEACVIIEKIAT